MVGTGPGAFTGLRVGIATAKGLAQAIGCPIVGISTAAALLAGQPPDAVLLLPAGPSDRLVATSEGPARLLPAGTRAGSRGRRRRSSRSTCPAARPTTRSPGARPRVRTSARRSIALGAARLATGDVDDLAGLVPEYVTLPRGVTTEGGEVAWSHDRR